MWKYDVEGYRGDAETCVQRQKETYESIKLQKLIKNL